MTPTEQKLIEALSPFICASITPRGQIVGLMREDFERALAAVHSVDAERPVEPPNFCARCGKRLTDGGVHTCSPMTNELARKTTERLILKHAEERAKLTAELEQARALAATAEKWRGLATAKFGDGRTVQEIQREAEEAEREECANLCDSYGGIWQQEMMAETSRKLARKIRARGQK